jgi:hypothetical protein
MGPVADGMSGRAGPTGRIAPTAWPEHSPSTRFRTRCLARGVQCSVCGGVTALALRHPAPQPWSTGCSRHGSAAVYFGYGGSSRRRRPATHPGLSSMEHPDSSPALPDLWTCGDPVRWRCPRRPGAGPRRRRHAPLTWRHPGDRPEDPAGVRGPGAVRRPVAAQARLPVQLRAASLLDSPRIVKQVDYAPRWRGHYVMIQASADLDDELRGWLQEATTSSGCRPTCRTGRAAGHAPVQASDGGRSRAIDTLPGRLGRGRATPPGDAPARAGRPT